MAGIRTAAGLHTASDSDPSLRPDLYERALAAAAIALLILVVTALWRGHEHWGEMDPVVWIHLATVMTPLAITPVQLLRGRADAAHRALGWIWGVALFGTAVISLAFAISTTVAPASSMSFQWSRSLPCLCSSSRRATTALHAIAEQYGGSSLERS